MPPIEDFLADATRRMDKSIESTRQEFNSVRTGRASPALLDRIHVDYYGTPTPLKNLATISAPEPRLLNVQPFDPNSVKAIEKAIQESDLGLQPSNDGKLIRLPIPQLTEERRKELVKIVRRYAEDGKVAIRNVRRDIMRHLEELVRNGEVGDDEERRAENQVQKLTDEHTKAIDELLKHKEAEIMMDGNGRWAKRRGLPVAAGHRAGTRALRRTVEAAIDLGVESLAVYAFSTENWTRPAEEVDALMEIFGETIERELPDLAKEGVRTRFLGRRDRAPAELQAQMAALEEETAANDRLHLWIAFDYGGRAELVEAARRLVESGVEPEEVDEGLLAEHLYAPEMLDPDLLVRTSGELRISNFLLWQLAYAELVFVDRLWPDFGEADLRSALEEYARRRRRFGGR